MILTFVTLNSGNVLHYNRTMTPDAAIHIVQDRLRQDGRLVNGWSVKLHTTTPEAATFDLLLDNIGVTHCWLCLSETVAERLWQDATTSELPIRARDRPTTVPWLAVRMAMSVIEIMQTRPARLIEAPQIEVCIAWALAGSLVT